MTPDALPVMLTVRVLFFLIVYVVFAENALSPIMSVGFVLTVTLQVRVLPVVRVAVIVAVPFRRAVTLPAFVTAATAFFEELQLLTVPPVTLRVLTAPAFSVADEAEILAGSVTWTFILKITPFTLKETVALPFSYALILMTSSVVSETIRAIVLSEVA